MMMTSMFSQTPVDTSYTISSTYKKEIKKFPFIKITKKPKNIEVIQQKDLIYKSIESRDLHLDAFYKKQKSSNPAVLLIHGGGWKSGNNSQMNLMAQEIASKGYSCFSIEYRLSDEAPFPAGIIDVKTAIKYIKENAKKFNVDTDKIAVLGCSSGGQMAALIGTTNGDKTFEEKNKFTQNSNVQAVIDMDGVLAFHHPESTEGKYAALYLGGTYEEKPEIWEKASALSNTNSNSQPILFINSDMVRFHAGRDDMIAILNRHQIYSEVKTIQNSPHSFWFFDPWFDEIVNYSTQFLDKIFKQK